MTKNIIKFKKGTKVKFTDEMSKKTYIGVVKEYCNEYTELYELDILKKYNPSMKKNDIYYVSQRLINVCELYDKKDKSMKIFKCMTCFKEFEKKVLIKYVCPFCKDENNLVVVKDV